MPFQDRPSFHATAYPVAPSSSRDPSVNMTSPGLSFSASLFASSRSCWISSALNGSGSSSRTVCSVLVQVRFKAVFSLLPMAVLPPITTFLASSPWGRLSSHSPNRRCLFSSWLDAGLSQDSIDSAPRLVVRKAPVVARACWLTSSCSSSARPVVPLTLPPFHHSSAPNMAMDWTHADMTRLQLVGERPILPVSRRSRVIAFLPLFSLVAWCSFSVSCESSHTPSHLVASLLKGTSESPTLTLAAATVPFFFRQNIAASVFPWSKATPLFPAHSMAAAAACDSLAATSSSFLPSAHHPMSSTKTDR